MRTFGVSVVALLAYATPAFCGTLRCVPNGRPYCCQDSVASLSNAQVKLGILCSEVGIGHKPKCHASQPTKICCDKNAIDLLGLGAVTICQLPDGLMSQLQALGGVDTLGGLLGGLGGGIGIRSFEELESNEMSKDES